MHSYQVKVSMHSDLFCYFHHVVCSDDDEVENGKPSPEIYLIAAKRFSILPKSNNCVSIWEYFVYSDGLLGHTFGPSLQYEVNL